MNQYVLMVEKIIEDHFTESEKILFAEKLLGQKKKAPKPMTQEDKFYNQVRHNLNKRKKK